jgi:hypothetical protein
VTPSFIKTIRLKDSGILLDRTPDVGGRGD